jgi:hypothetical protein
MGIPHRAPRLRELAGKIIGCVFVDATLASEQ